MYTRNIFIYFSRQRGGIPFRRNRSACNLPEIWVYKSECSLSTNECQSTCKIGGLFLATITASQCTGFSVMLFMVVSWGSFSTEIKQSNFAFICKLKPSMLAFHIRCFSQRPQINIVFRPHFALQLLNNVSEWVGYDGTLT